MSGYNAHDVAQTYLDNGWSVFPLPVGKKSPPPVGLTGYGAERATITDDVWTEAPENANLGVWASPGILGIDVDAYVKKGATKAGDVTLAELERQLGPLPPTWISSARELPSGIRWFRVPPEVLFVSKLVGIEFIQPSHRYGVVPPSTNPDADGATYRWFVRGKSTRAYPKVSQLAELPDEWVEHLTRQGRSRTTAQRADGNEEDAREWLRTYGVGEPCRAVRGVLRAHLATLDDGSSRYDNMVAGQMALLHLIGEGHLGGSWAMPQLKAAYLEATADEGRDTEGEWRRALVAGVLKERDSLDGPPKAHTPAKCPTTLNPFTDSSLWPPPTAPRDVADRFTRECYTVETERTLRHWREDFYTWRGSHWKTRSVAQLDAHLSAVLASASYQTAAATPTEAPWRPSPTKIKAVLGALASFVNRDDELDADDSSGAGIAFANGVLDMTTRLLKPHSPAWFNLGALPYEFDPSAPEPVQWFAFLESLWGDGEEIELLQEWIGYLLSGRIDLHAMAVLVGPTRAGKGVITHVCEALVGADNHTGLRVENIASNFGLERAVGKSLITLGDARFTSKNARDAVENLLSIVGGDTVTIDRKNRPAWVGVVGGRFMISTNEPPAIPDSASAMNERMLVIPFRETFKDNPDRSLLPRLLTELPGILNWALLGYDRLVSNGGVWTVPESSEVLKTEIEELGAPVKAFMRERCQPDARASTAKNTLYEAWCRWCDDNGKHATSSPVFFRDLYSAYPKLRPVRQGSRAQREQAVGGVALREPTRERGDLR